MQPTIHRPHRRRTGGLLAALVVGAVVVTGVPVPAVAAAPQDAGLGPSLNHGFVTRDGSQLELGGEPFRFGGTNAYWLGVDENVPAGVVDYPTYFRIRDAIDTAAAMGTTVIRSHMLASTGNDLSILPSKDAGFSEGAFDTVDYAIAYAATKGIRLILPLTDNWAYYHGGLRDFARTYGLCADPSADCPQFYSDPRVIADFQDYVATMLNHVNRYTGVALKDDPTVMAWELGNELEGMTPTWIATISAQLRAGAPEQLVAAGRRFDIDPDTLAADVDIVDVHYYPPTVAKVSADAKTVTDAGKAYIAGEYDSNSASAVLPGLVDNPDVTGMLSWSLFPHDDTSGFVQHLDGFQIHYPGDDPGMKEDVAAQRAYAAALGSPGDDSVTRPPLITSVTDDYGLHRLAWRGATGAVGYDVQVEAVDGWTTLTDEPVGDAPWLDTETRGAATYRVVPIRADGSRGPASAPLRVGAGEQVGVDALGSLTPAVAHSGVDVSPAGEETVVAPTGDDGGSVTWSAPGLAEARLTVLSAERPRLALAAGSGSSWTDLAADVSPAGDGRWTVTASGTGAEQLRVTWPAGSTDGLTRVELRSAPQEAVLVDPLDDLDRTSAANAVAIDTGDGPLFGGDTGRAKRTAPGSASLEWTIGDDVAPDGVTGFEASAYYWPDQSAETLAFSVSEDGTTWRPLTPDVATTPGVVGGAWRKDVVTARALTGVRHVRVEWPQGSTPEWAQQLGEIRFLATGSGGGAPSGVTTTTPADGTDGVRGVPTFTWTASRAALYRVVLSAHADLSDPVASTSTASTSWVPEVALDESTTYYWHVTALNGAGQTSSDTAAFATATRPTAPKVVDDYESYATDADVSKAYVRNTGGGTIAPTLVASGASGQAMSLAFDLGSPGYAGVTRTFAEPQDWWGYDGLSMWLDRTALEADQKISVQLVAGGSYWEATLPQTGPHAPGVVTVPFADFAPPAWAGDSGPLDLTRVTQLSFYLGGAGTGTLLVDDVRAVRTDTAAPSLTLTTTPDQPGSGWFTGAVDVVASAKDAVDAHPAVELQVGDGAWKAATEVRVTAQGSTVVRARATDEAGNTSDVVDRTVRIDSVAPAVAASLKGRVVTFAATDASSGVAKVQYRFAGGDWLTAEGSVRVPTDVASLQYRAVDVAGNASAVASLATHGSARAVVLALGLPPIVRAGAPAQVLVQVLGTRGPASGAVTVTDAAGTVVGSADLTHGRATIRLTAPTSAGTHRFVVRYTGDATYAPSTGQALLYVIGGKR